MSKITLQDVRDCFKAAHDMVGGTHAPEDMDEGWAHVEEVEAWVLARLRKLARLERDLAAAERRAR